MTCRSYRLVYRAMSPVHIGHYMLGYINRTRYYIPGRAMWGAITANLTRTFYRYEDYKDVGTDIMDNVLLSYFYPATDPNQPLQPRFTDKGLRFGLWTAADFERNFIKAFGQTAILPSSNTAEDESLHEVEFISPVVEPSGMQSPVFFVGYLLMKEGTAVCGKDLNWDSGLVSLKPAIQELFVGGERKYGFGRLSLVEDPPLTPDKEGNCWLFGNKLVATSAGVSIEVECDKPIPAHLHLDGALNLKGDVEPLVGREWGEVDSPEGRKTGAGQRITPATLCWVPGSVLSEKAVLQIEPYGLLAMVPAQEGENSCLPSQA